VTGAQQRAVVIAILCGSLISACLIVTWAFLIATGLSAPAYTFQLSLIVQAHSKQASHSASAAPMLAAATWISDIHASAVPTAAQMQALDPDRSLSQNWITVTHYSVASRNIESLDHLEALIKSSSPWKVVDISSGNEFVPVEVRPGVTVLRLAELVGTADNKLHVRLQVSDPKVRISAGDVLFVCLLLFVVISFAATEINSTDAFAYPRGMHPVVVASQIITLALFACVLMALTRTSGAPQREPAFLLVDIALALGVARWLWVSRSCWSNGRALIYARIIIGLYLRIGRRRSSSFRWRDVGARR
jgi:hypothetical protein